MIIEPKIRGFICTTAHPVGCAQHVTNQINYVKQQKSVAGPKRVLIIGSSTGYGLASRIVAAFSSHAATVGVCFEKPAEGKRTASAGWYNTAAFEQAANKAGIYAKTINGDAFSDAIRNLTIETIVRDLKQVDLVIYSLASPRRIHPKTGEIFSSTLKPVGKPFSAKTVNPMTGEVSTISLEPATAEDIAHTEAVMGGEDWAMWIDALEKANALAKGAVTVAYSYVGPEVTFPIYRDGTIGLAKKHLEKTAQQLNQQLATKLNGRAYISVNKAVVTQSSAAIPVVPLYISLLFQVMKNKHNHEDCIEQIYRLFNDRLYSGQANITDEQDLIRLDDYEMGPEIQAEVIALWQKVNTENLTAVSDITGYRNDFHRLFGFGLAGVDYQQEVDPQVEIPSLALTIAN